MSSPHPVAPTLDHGRDYSPAGAGVGAPGGGRSALRVVVADDAPEIRRMLSLVLTTTPGLALVGEAEDGPGAIAVVEDRHPDVLIVDNRMPGLEGIDVIRRLREEGLAVRIVMFSSDPSVELLALESGADAFMLKGAVGPVELVDYLTDAPPTITVHDAVHDARRLRD